jgi:hypothetical protein
LNRTAATLALFAILAGACGDDGPSRDESGRVTHPQSVAVSRLLTGDCFNDPDADQVGDIRVVEVVPCEQPHDTEIYHSFTLTEGARPDDDALEELAAGQCFPAFDAFVGIEFEISEMDLFLLTPSAEQWDDGHRTLHCILFNLDLSELVGSARGTAR